MIGKRAVTLALLLGVAIVPAASMAADGGLYACHPPDDKKNIIFGNTNAVELFEKLHAEGADPVAAMGTYTVQSAFMAPEVSLLVGSMRRTFVLFDKGASGADTEALGPSASRYGLDGQTTSGCQLLHATPVCENQENPGVFDPC